MANNTGRLYKSFIILLLLGIFIELGALVSIFRGDDERNGNIAVVEVAGPIEDSKDTIKRLKKYEDNEKVKAIVVRVNSPGGTVGASQEIHDEILRIKDKKKIIVSMGDVAASGGYYLSAPANKIVANPGTLTGSIGVIATYFVVDDLLRKFHLKWEVIQAGKMKDIGSPLRSLTADEKLFLKQLTEDMHNQFIEAVSKGRNLSIEKTKELADGRIFSGKQAQELGLVDELGSLEFAIQLAAREVNLKEKPKAIYPPEEKFGFFKNFSDRTFFRRGLQVLFQQYP
ncbi:MAG: signal peptide peptidase SppA [Bdellovibrionales bacterium]|nr:signal peptide peptidase SppA [Bdellovibrionales bacterium]